MKGWLIPALLMLSACAPSQTQSAARTPAPLPFQADFTDAGVTWVSGGKAYVARAPNLTAQLAPLPTPAVAAAWVGRVAWGALPDAGIIVTLDGPPETQVVGRVARLSHQRIYLQDGAAVSYGGGAAGGVIGFPSTVLTGSSNTEYALVKGDLYLVGSPATLLSSVQLKANAAAYLYRLPIGGVAVAALPSLQTDQGLYQLTGNALERRNGTDQIINSVPHSAGLIGEVGGRVVTLSADGKIRVFLSDLREVRP